ncbi:hypothetical protein HMPREF9449_00938 [Odoribacter laneus YIT 12061]|uniref:EpsG family protein n=1 Tax=Odoribacter laneus YIT 12061 TaxID=742817 RepID=H1DFA2_9BACT|nr:hypothetical protein HMPREF9449_00938 [Odoribacter laneus YIT 12061]
MWVLSICSCIAILLTYLESIGKFKKGMLWGFVIMTIVAALRYDYGTDYMAYLSQFNSIADSSFTLSYYVDFSDGLHEQGWKILMYLFKPLGFYVFAAILAIFNSVVYYRLIDKFVPKGWWAFAVFIYLFTYSFYPMQLSMLRQGLAMSFILFAIPYILDKKKIIPIISLILSATIHTSALICIPFVLLFYIPFANRKLMVIGLVAAFAIFIFAQDLVFRIMSDLVMSSAAFDKYDSKYFGGLYDVSETKNLLGTIIFLIPILVSLYALMTNRHLTESNIKLIVFTLIGSLVSLTGQMVAMIDRVSWYYTIMSIVTYPIVYKSIHVNIVRNFLLLFIIAITLRDYFGFMTAEGWIMYYGEYQSILSVL